MAKIPQLYPMIENHLVHNSGSDPNGAWLREWCRAAGGEPRRASVEFRPLPDDLDDLCTNCRRALHAWDS